MSLAASQVAGGTTGVSPRLLSQETVLLRDFADVLNAEGCLPPSTHGVEHHIITESRPVPAKFRLWDNIKLAVAKEEFHYLELEGIVCHSNSDWASPLHIVQKSEGT